MLMMIGNDSIAHTEQYGAQDVHDVEGSQERKKAVPSIQHLLLLNEIRGEQRMCCYKPEQPHKVPQPAQGFVAAQLGHRSNPCIRLFVEVSAKAEHVSCNRSMVQVTLKVVIIAPSQLLFAVFAFAYTYKST